MTYLFNFKEEMHSEQIPLEADTYLSQRDLTRLCGFSLRLGNGTEDEASSDHQVPRSEPVSQLLPQPGSLLLGCLETGSSRPSFPAGSSGLAP